MFYNSFPFLQNFFQTLTWNFFFSKGLSLSIKYKPVCIAPTIQKKDNGIDLVCTVDSKPQATTYRWLFNSSETTFEIPSAESTMFFSNYKSSAEEGHGQVLCWASNSLGEQYHPCVFRVVPLGSPAPPRDCRVSKTRKPLTHSSCTITQRDKKFYGKVQIALFSVQTWEPQNEHCLSQSGLWIHENPDFCIWNCF